MTHLVLRPLITTGSQTISHHGPGPCHDRLGLDLRPPLGGQAFIKHHQTIKWIPMEAIDSPLLILNSRTLFRTWDAVHTPDESTKVFWVKVEQVRGNLAWLLGSRFFGRRWWSVTFNSSKTAKGPSNQDGFIWRCKYVTLCRGSYCYPGTGICCSCQWWSPWLPI